LTMWRIRSFSFLLPLPAPRLFRQRERVVLGHHNDGVEAADIWR